MQRSSVRGFWIHSKHACIKSGAGWDVFGIKRDGYRHIAEIHRLIPENAVSTVITPTQWRQFWQVVNEETSSSESGLHFGHYKVGCKSDLITHYHTARVSVTLAYAIQLERWSRGLSIMLEKTLGVTLVT